MITCRALHPIHDAELIESAMLHPSVYPWITDDAAPDIPAGFIPSPDHFYAGCFKGEEFLGLFAFMGLTDAKWEVHTCLLPVAYGPSATECAKLAERALWAHDPRAARIVSMIPADNPRALRFAKRCGMVEWGRNPAAFRRKGTLYDEVWVGLSRPEGV